jgi:hypothetical protein
MARSWAPTPNNGSEGAPTIPIGAAELDNITI